MSDSAVPRRPALPDDGVLSVDRQRVEWRHPIATVTWWRRSDQLWLSGPHWVASLDLTSSSHDAAESWISRIARAIVEGGLTTGWFVNLAAAADHGKVSPEDRDVVVRIELPEATSLLVLAHESDSEESHPDATGWPDGGACAARCVRLGADGLIEPEPWTLATWTAGPGGVWLLTSDGESTDPAPLLGRLVQ